MHLVRLRSCANVQMIYVYICEYIFMHYYKTHVYKCLNVCMCTFPHRSTYICTYAYDIYAWKYIICKHIHPYLCTWRILDRFTCLCTRMKRNKHIYLTWCCRGFPVPTLTAETIAPNTTSLDDGGCSGSARNSGISGARLLRVPWLELSFPWPVRVVKCLRWRVGSSS